MTLIKTTLLNGIAVVIKMLALLGINKILAIFVGPSGYAALGQFQNASQIIITFATGAINTGVTKYTAEFHQDQQSQYAVWRTAGTIALSLSLLSAIFVVAFNKQLAIWFLKNEDFGSVFIWFAASLVLFVFNTLLLAILNGKKEIERYVIANISGSIFALAFTASMTIWLGLFGALVAMAVYQSLTFFTTSILIWRTKWFRVSYIFGQPNLRVAKNLAKYAGMALTTAICVPVSHLFIRNHLGETLGWEEAGYWEAMWRLSAAYLMLVTTPLAVYYLPRISELQKPTEIKKELAQAYKFILPLTAVSAIAIYLLRYQIIDVLFTSEFNGMEFLFAWQLTGDTLKIFSWLLAYILVAKAYVSLFILSEILSAFSFVIVVKMLTEPLGLEATTVAHTINYGAYSLFLIFALKLKNVL